MKVKLISKQNPMKREESKFYANPVNIGRKSLSSIATDMAGRSSLTRGDIENVLSNFVDLLAQDPADIRADVFLKATADEGDKVFGGAKVYLNKMPRVGGDPRYANVPMLRLSEVYLTAAEAAFKSGDKAKAAQYLNDVIKNRTTDTSRLVTAADITAVRISLERRKELVGEGQRFFDAVRNNETITRYTDDGHRGWHDVLTEVLQELSFHENLPV